MYLPAHFEETRPEVLHRFIQAHPLATLIVHDQNGLSADHIPLTLRADELPHGRLLGHVARANPLWQKARGGMDCLAVFHGPQHYISPNGYASKAESGRVVPTWNYEVVQVHGKLTAVDDPVWLHRLLAQLTQEHEASQAQPWALHDAPPDYLDRMLQVVVGIEIEIVRLVGKAKLSQNQPPANQRSLLAALRALGDAASAEMAQAIEGRVLGG